MPLGVELAEADLDLARASFKEVFVFSETKSSGWLTVPQNLRKSRCYKNTQDLTCLVLSSTNEVSLNRQG